MTPESTLCFFFFQAEDGIRDGTVTGVQTWALPILPSLGAAAGRRGRRGHGPGIEDAWRRRQDRRRKAARPGPDRRERRRRSDGCVEPRQADRERPPVRGSGGR